jgi:hypothetical protein
MKRQAGPRLTIIFGVGMRVAGGLIFGESVLLSCLGGPPAWA